MEERLCVGCMNTTTQYPNIYWGRLGWHWICQECVMERWEAFTAWRKKQEEQRLTLDLDKDILREGK